MKSGGIYKIINITNNKLYIGSAIDLKSRKRQHWHLLNNNKHHSKYLQRSFNKYKKENFIFETIENCKAEDLIKREQYYIDSLKPEYNICKIAGSKLGIKANKSSRNKMSISHKNMDPEKRNYINQKIKEAVQKKMLQYDLKGNLIKEWNSFKEYVEITGDCNKNIISVCKGKRKTASGYVFKYKTNE